MKWGLVCKYNNKKSISLGEEVYEFLSENGEVFAEEGFAKEAEIKGFSLEEINKKTDIVVSVGEMGQ